MLLLLYLGAGAFDGYFFCVADFVLLASFILFLLILFSHIAFPKRSPRLLTRSAKGTPLVSRSNILQQCGLISSAGILALTGGPFLLNIETASADEAGAAGEQSYFDEKYKVAFEHIPAKWGRTDTTIGTNNLDPRRIVVFKDPSSEANVFIAYTVGGGTRSKMRISRGKMEEGN